MNHRSTHRRIANQLAVIAASVTLFMASAAFAASPGTSLIEGVMTSSGGGAAADGTYDVTFSLWETEVGGTATWSEGPVKVAVKGGQFSYALGTSAAIDIQKVAALKAQWLGLKIGADPALPRQKVHSSLFALWAGTAGGLTCTGCLTSDHIANGTIAAGKMGFNYAGSDTKGGPANDLKCTGCVSVAEMKFDGDVDLGANSLKGKNGTFSGDLVAATVTSTSFIGDGSKLTGIKTPSGECKTKGEVVKGINADGTLKCVAALDPSALPADGLNEISNNLLTNQFVYTVSAPVKNLKIPDNTGSTADSVITFPNIGTAQTLDVKVTVENSDLSHISMVLLPPDDKKTGYTLCDPCGKENVRKLVATYNTKNPPLKQDGDGKKIGDWIGGNPQGTWTLKVLDDNYCVVQIAENKVLCADNKNDGWITDWSISMQYISNKKVGVNGDQETSGNLTVDKGVTVGGDITVAGSITVNGQKWSNGRFPEGSRPFLWGYDEDKLNSAYINNPFYSYAYQVPTDYGSLHITSPEIVWGDKYGNIRRQRGGVNYGNGSEDRSSGYLVAFVKNTTASNIVHKVCFYYSGYNGNYTGIAINKSNVWSTTSNTHGGACANMTIPANKSSVVVLKSGSRYYTNWNGQYTRMMIGFYSNTWNLPTGIKWDYEAYNNWIANKY